MSQLINTLSFSKILKKCQKDPLFFSANILSIGTPWEMQKKIMQAIAIFPRVTVRSGHGVGKSWVSSQIALWFLFSFPNSTVLVTAPTSRQVFKVIWAYISNQYKKSKVPLGGRLLWNELRVTENWFALGLATDDPDRFQGFHSTDILIIVDEAAGVKDAIFDGIKGCLTSQNARLLLLGNPTSPVGYFAKSHSDGVIFNPNNKEDFFRFRKLHISSYDSPNVKQEKEIFPGLVTKEWIEAQKKEWGEDTPIFNARVKGEFPDVTEDGLFTLAQIEKAQNNDPDSDNLKGDGLYVLGVDVARFGSDETVIIRRKGNVVEEIKAFYSLDITETIGIILNQIKKYQIDIVNIDVIGYGAGVVDGLKEQLRYLNIKCKINGINVGEKARNSEKFRNKRAEYYWHLKKIIEDIYLPQDNKLVTDLFNTRYRITSNGQVAIFSKEEIKKLIKRSPDRGDALMLAFANPEDADDLYTTPLVVKGDLIDEEPTIDNSWILDKKK